MAVDRSVLPVTVGLAFIGGGWVLATSKNAAKLCALLALDYVSVALIVLGGLLVLWSIFVWRDGGAPAAQGVGPGLSGASPEMKSSIVAKPFSKVTIFQTQPSQQGEDK